MTAQHDGRYVGRSVARGEDARLVTGATRWTDNLRAPGALHLAVVRSPEPRARVGEVDVGRALARREVVAAFGGRELADLWREPFPVIIPPGGRTVEHYPLAVDEARHVGDGVACLLATSRDAAADAVEDVVVDYEPLPVVATVDDALDGEALVHEGLGTNVAFDLVADPAGDVDEAFAGADVVVERRYVNNRVVVTAMEPRATLAVPEPGGGVSVYTSTQVPHRIRDHLARLLGLDPATLRVVAPDVGGAFGAKLDCYPEDVLCTALALRTGRPVRFTATRSEDFTATYQGRGQVQHVAVSARADGTLLGMRAHVLADIGAYPSRNGMNIPLNARAMLPGCYRWQAYAFRCTGLLTNTVPTGPYRGAGRPEATFAVERAVDDLAHALGLDPADLRRRNFPAPEEFPFVNVAGLTYDSGRYAETLDLALDVAGYADLRREQAAAGDPGDDRSAARGGRAVRVGVGISSYVDRCGAGPGMPEWSMVRVDRRGGVEVRTGLSPHGQGTATTLGQIVADALGTSPDLVTVIHSDTRAVPEGTGTFGSRSMPVGASSVQLAADRVAAKARGLAAHLLEAAVDDVAVVPGGYQVRGSADARVTLADVARAAYARDRPEGVQPGLEASGLFEPRGFTVPFGTHVAVVEIDVETGQATVRRYVAVDDVGNAVNPQVLDGQFHGGIAQGIGQALFEEAAYEGGVPVAATLVDYHLPGAPDVPAYELRRTVTPTDVNPLGFKGAAEAGTIAAPPAVVNAIVDALRPLGVNDVAMPCTPARVWRAVREARAPSAAQPPRDGKG